MCAMPVKAGKEERDIVRERERGEREREKMKMMCEKLGKRKEILCVRERGEREKKNANDVRELMCATVKAV